MMQCATKCETLRMDYQNGGSIFDWNLIVCSDHYRSSRSQMFFKIGAFKNLTNFTGKRMCRSIFLIEFQTFFLFKRDTPTQVFSVRLAKFFGTSSFIEHLWWLLLSLFKKPYENCLKLLSAIYYQIVIFHQMIAVQKLWKMFFISSKKLFLLSRYSNFCIFDFPCFFPCQPLL